MDEIRKSRELSLQAEREHYENLKYKPREASMISQEFQREIEKNALRKQLLDKSLSYAKNVKIIFPPRVDEQKRAELETLKAQIVTKSKKSETIDEDYNNSRNGKNIIEELRKKRLAKVNISL